MESISRVGSYMYTLLLFLTHYTIGGIFNTCKEFSYSVRSSEVPLEYPTHNLPKSLAGIFFLCRFVNIYFHTFNLYTILRVLIHKFMQINYDLSYEQHLRQLEKAWFRKVHRDQPQLGIVEILEIAKHNFIDMVRNCEEYDVELLEELG